MKIRKANRSDISLILDFIKKLAIYEKLENEVSATEELLDKWLFIEKKAEVIFAVVDNKEIGFALYFYNFSTFLGKAGLYLEDLYIDKAYRGSGYGKKLLVELANIALENECGRLEWTCLNWNEPSINFYLSIGARRMDEWTVYRLTGNMLEGLAKKKVD